MPGLFAKTGFGAVLLVFCLRPPAVFAVDYTRVASCYFQEHRNSPPRWSVDKCEILSSTGQGFYSFRIVFNDKREYLAKGGHRLSSWHEAEAMLNGMPAKYSQKNGYSCWTTQPVREPFRVCFES